MYTVEVSKNNIPKIHVEKETINQENYILYYRLKYLL